MRHDARLRGFRTHSGRQRKRSWRNLTPLLPGGLSRSAGEERGLVKAVSLWCLQRELFLDKDTRSKVQALMVSA